MINNEHIKDKRFTRYVILELVGNLALKTSTYIVHNLSFGEDIINLC